MGLYSHYFNFNISFLTPENVSTSKGIWSKWIRRISQVLVKFQFWRTQMTKLCVRDAYNSPILSQHAYLSLAQIVNKKQVERAVQLTKNKLKRTLPRKY